jgi:hypothetical protein
MQLGGNPDVRGEYNETLDFIQIRVGMNVKVGLLRHFKVTLGYPDKMVSSDGLLKWQKDYDESEVEETDIDLNGITWKRCFSSDLARASKTAKKAFDGNIIYLEDLREMTLNPLLPSNIKLPLWLHITMIRIAWLIGHKSQKENKKAVIQRINTVLDQAIQHDEDVLIVGHGGIMMFMRKELLKRGFSGPKFNRPENAIVYVFEKQ